MADDSVLDRVNMSLNDLRSLRRRRFIPKGLKVDKTGFALLGVFRKGFQLCHLEAPIEFVFDGKGVALALNVLAMSLDLKTLLIKVVSAVRGRDQENVSGFPSPVLNDRDNDCGDGGD
ncbi:hypothetical protein DDK07_07725 [Mycobacteroides abscessus]|nr:hypothetical protein DDK07_07725 [Mycobacteroides abscessus]RIR80147.1 hypothetical protein D2E68_03905 [Mycobacteroides abscessus]RIT30009.1 hypothetical protein D2E73_00700 [Mycobacteroides abscessus]RIT38037.1 hypothetical protein D2E99_00700 [Mycobacteroides abscessus]